MKRDKKLWQLGLLLGAAFLAVGCGEKKDGNNQAKDNAGTSEQMLTVATKDPQVPLDMQQNTYTVIMQITDSTTESLLVTNEDGDLEPVLLTGMPEMSEDKLVYTFELKEDVSFHNGERLKSSDVKYSYERMIQKIKMASLLEKVVGYQDFADGKNDELTGFEIIDDTHFTITLTSPYSPFLSVLSTPYCAIYPEKAAEEAGDAWGLKTLYGTGPFKLDSYTAGKEAVVVKFDEYHGEETGLDKIVFKFIANPNTQVLEYQKGTVDVVSALDSALYPTYANGELKDELYDFQPVGGFYLGLNVKDISDVKVREAISLSIDREAITESIVHGTAKPATSFLPEGLIGHDEKAEVYPYDPAKAKELLAEAGYADGYDLTITANTVTDVSVSIATAIQAQAKESGINVSIEKVDSAAWTDMKKQGKVACGVGSWYVDYNDPDSMLYPYGDGRTDYNSSFYHNDEFKQLLEDGVLTSDKAERQQIYQEAEQLLTRRDFAAVPIYNEKMFYLKKDYVENFKLSSNQRFFYHDAVIKK